MQGSPGCALSKIEGSQVLWLCKGQGARHMISTKKRNLDCLVAQEQQGQLGTARAQSCYVNILTTLQVKVFAWSPFGNLLFWFRETFWQIKSPTPKF